VAWRPGDVGDAAGRRAGARSLDAGRVRVSAAPGPDSAAQGPDRGLALGLELLRLPVQPARLGAAGPPGVVPAPVEGVHGVRPGVDIAPGFAGRAPGAVADGRGRGDAAGGAERSPRPSADALGELRPMPFSPGEQAAWRHLVELALREDLGE